MKLPQALSSGVRPIQAEGTQDIDNILRVQQAQNQALHAAGSAGIAWQRSREESKLANTVDESLRKYSEMQTTLSQAGAVDLADDELVPSGLRDEIMEGREDDFDSLKDEGGTAHVPAFEVRGEIHDYYLDKIMQEGRDSLGSSRRLQDRFTRAMSSPTINGAHAILKKNMQEERAALSSNADRLYDSAVLSGNLDQAVDIIASASETGIWSIEKANETLGKVEGDIEFSNGINVILNGSADDIELLQSSMGKESKMSSAQKWELYSKSDKVMGEKQKEFKQKSNEASSSSLNDALINMDNDGAFSEKQLRRTAQSMNPDHARILINANRAARNATSTRANDPFTENRLGIRVMQLAYPDEDVPYAQRKQAVYNEIYGAMGYDQSTETYTGRSSITQQTGSRLLNEVNRATDRLLTDPRFKADVDYGYMMLTGGAKSQFSFNQDGKLAATVARFERAFINAYLEGGPGFDSGLWLEKNMELYQTEASRNNEEKAKLIPYENHVVVKEQSLGDESFKIIDLPASLIKVEESLVNNLIDDEFAAMLLNKMEDEYSRTLMQRELSNARNK